MASNEGQQSSTAGICLSGNAKADAESIKAGAVIGTVSELSGKIAGGDIIEVWFLNSVYTAASFL